jgi:hypothetical protein
VPPFEIKIGAACGYGTKVLFPTSLAKLIEIEKIESKMKKYRIEFHFLAN